MYTPNVEQGVNELQRRYNGPLGRCMDPRLDRLTRSTLVRAARSPDTTNTATGIWVRDKKR